MRGGLIGFLTMKILTRSTPPEARPRRTNTKRLTPQIRAMKQGQSLVDLPATARSAAIFFSRKGWRCVSRKLPDGQQQLWILNPSA